MEKEYILPFSSFYKAAYAQDVLDHAGITASLRKLPTELIRSCSTGLYLRTDHLQQAIEVMRGKEIRPLGLYELQRQGRGQKRYVKLGE